METVDKISTEPQEDVELDEETISNMPAIWVVSSNGTLDQADLDAGINYKDHTREIYQWGNWDRLVKGLKVIQ